MTKERKLIRDLVLLLEGVINPGILRFCGEAQALTNAKQYLAAPPATDNSVSDLENMKEDIDALKIDLRVATDRQAKVNDRLDKMQELCKSLDERTKAREGSIEWLTRDSGSMNDRLARIEAKFQDLMKRQSDDHQFSHNVADNLGVRLADLEWAADPRWKRPEDKNAAQAIRPIDDPTPQKP